DDVVNGAWPSTLHGERGCVRGILDVDQRPLAVAATDYQDMSLGDLVDKQVIEKARIDSVERAIPKDHSLEVGPVGHTVFKIPDGVERAAKLSRRARV